MAGNSLFSSEIKLISKRTELLFSTRVENKIYILRAIVYCLFIVNKYRESKMWYLNGSTMSTWLITLITSPSCSKRIRPHPSPPPTLPLPLTPRNSYESLFLAFRTSVLILSCHQSSSLRSHMRSACALPISVFAFR